MEALVQAAIQLVGELISTGQRNEAEALLTRLQTEFRGIPLPKLEEIEAQQLGPSALEGIKADPTLESAQYDSLGQLGDLARDGMASADRAALNRIANQTARRQRAGMAGIESSMAQRGLGGSGLEYGARVANAQDANQRLSEEGQNIAGDAANRRMNAILARGDMSGRMRGQQYSEKANAAKARDDIMKYNAGMRDSANRYNKALPQQRWQNQMQQMGAVANPTNALAGFKIQSANDTRNAAAGYGAAASRFLEEDEEDKKKDGY